MHINPRWKCFVAAWAAVGPALLAASPASTAVNREEYQVEARAIQIAPQLDGALNEEVWIRADVIDAFVQQEPTEGALATERTEVRVLYDETTLYIGVRAYDSGPVLATEMRRDSERMLEEDNFQVIVDTFNDSRNGYMFVTNPLGARLEQQIFEEGQGARGDTNSNINRNWDGVWQAAAAPLADGWSAEMAIPLKTLRFRDIDEQIWGINFMRNIRRKNEKVFWAPIPKAYTLTRVSQAGTLTGLTSVSQGMDLRIKPFATTGFESSRLDSTGLDNTALGDVGLDATYGVTPGMNLDLTVNTDFAQAEVDEQQVNLTRFNLFFPEKRDFFLENAGQFLVGTVGFRREANLFFSRRIGLSSTGEPVPILAGARLTGKSGRSNIALMDIQTADDRDRPGENFLVTRISRDVFSRSRIGGMLINKQATSGGDFNRTIAADASFAFGRALTMNSFFAKTASPGVSDGQLAYHGRVAWTDQDWNLWLQYTDIEDEFNAEVGFVPRVGIRTTNFHIGPTPRPKRFNIRVMRPMINVTYTTDQTNRLLSRRVHYMLGVEMEDGTFINAVYNRLFENLDNPFFIQPDLAIPVGPYGFGEWRFEFNTNPSKRFYERFLYSPQTFFGGTRKDIELTTGVRATSQFATEFQYRRNDVDLPGGEFVVNLGIVRFDYAISPDMTLRSLIQYNSFNKDVNTSVRFNYRYTPGSDLWVAYDELRDTGFGIPIQDRQLVVKLTYLLSR